MWRWAGQSADWDTKALENKELRKAIFWDREKGEAHLFQLNGTWHDI